MIKECPECGGQLEFWREYYFVKRQLINKRTGELNKKVRKSRVNESDIVGYDCTVCDFEDHGWL